MNLSKKDNKVNSIENRPAWGSNTLKNKKNKIRENLKQEKIINSNNIKEKVAQRKKKNLKFKQMREEAHKKRDELQEEAISKQNQLIKLEKEKEIISMSHRNLVKIESLKLGIPYQNELKGDKKDGIGSQGLKKGNNNDEK